MPLTKAEIEQALRIEYPNLTRIQTNAYAPHLITVHWQDDKALRITTFSRSNPAFQAAVRKVLET